MRSVRTPTRSRPGSAPTSALHGRAGGGAVYGSPGHGPAVTSSTPAVSRTDRVNTCSWVTMPQNSPKPGPSDVRPRLGLSPTRPQWADGTRIEPPMSLPCANAIIPAATAAPDPPDEPPAERSRSHGFRVGPYAAGSVVKSLASSGVLVLPTITKPADRKRRTR